LSNKFFRSKNDCPALIEISDGIFKPSKAFNKAIKNKDFRSALLEIIDFGIYRYKLNYSNNYPNTCFNINKKYTYADVCWLLNWKVEEVSLNIGGYKHDRYTNTYPIFINYDKSDDISATTRYEDRFIDPSNLIAISKNNRTRSSEDVDNAIHGEERRILMPLFVRKNKDDMTSKEFYFLGTVKHNGHIHEFIMPNTDNTSAVEIGYHLNTPVDSNLFEYITERTL
jgi:hypothetical protein